jgi:hypothetical protein
MDLISSIIDTYFRLMEYVNVKNVSILIIVIIIGIEFVEFFSGSEEEENSESHKKRPGKQVKNKLIRRVFGLESKNKKMLERMGVNEAQAMQGSPEEAGGRSQRPVGELESLLPPPGAEARVIGSKTYTVRTVLDGNYIYMEKVEEKGGC